MPFSSGIWPIRERSRLDESNVYFSVTGPDPHSTTGALMLVPKAGGTAVVLTRAQSPARLTLDGDVLYVATARGVLRVPLNGGEAVSLGLGPTEHVAVDDSVVYFDYWSHDVYRAAK